jgi:hypothetical protein
MDDWWSTTFDHDMYPGKTIVMFSGEDDDYRWYGDAFWNHPVKDLS